MRITLTNHRSNAHALRCRPVLSSITIAKQMHIKATRASRPTGKPLFQEVYVVLHVIFFPVNAREPVTCIYRKKKCTT